MIPIREAIADLKKAIAQLKGAQTRLDQLPTTPTHARLSVELDRATRTLQEELRGLKYVQEQERRSLQVTQ